MGSTTDHHFGSSAHLHRPLIVPPNVAEEPAVFIKRLFEVVNDPMNSDIIMWSFTGDSFFVLDHKRLEREVLPRWFKHNHFSGFVRQLNMYGFYKVPHLQQGVLRSDTDTMSWNFAHPYFIRGRPELLSRIQRKKQNLQVQQQQPDAALVTDGNANGVGSSRPGLTRTSPSTGLVLSRL